MGNRRQEARQQPSPFHLRDDESVTGPPLTASSSQAASSSMASGSITSRAWEKALARRQSSCSTDLDSTIFQGKSSPEAIIRDFQASQYMRSQTSKMHAFMTKLEPLASFMERLSPSMDVFVNALPEMLSPIWGTLRTLLMVVREHRSYFFKLMDNLEQMGDLLPGYRVYEEIFQKHKSVQDALLQVYEEMVSFLVAATRIFSKSSSIALLLRVPVKSFDQTFQRSLVGLERHRNLVERAVNIAQMVNIYEMRLEVDKVRSLVDDGPAKVKSWLAARSCHQVQSGIEILSGTCDWVILRPELQEWMRVGKDSTDVMWLHGGPGCGKSFLYTKILRHLKKTTDMPCMFFFFCAADKERVTLSSLFRSWTLQLVNTFDAASEHAIKVVSDSTRQEASDQEVQSLFFSLLELVPPCYLTVDGLDECIEAGQIGQMEQIKKILRSIPRKFKVLVTSRYLVNIDHLQQNTETRYRSFMITQEMTQSDIQKYIVAESKNLEHRFDEPVLTSIRTRLTAAEGMFLWVHLMFKLIQEQTNNEEVIKCLDIHCCPAELHQIYSTTLEKINSMPKPQCLLAHKVFYWVLVARRPLRVKELCCLLAIQPTADQEECYDSNRHIKKDADSLIISVCGSLILPRGPGGDLYPIHTTVTEHLTRYFARNGTLSHITSYYNMQDMVSSDGLAAAICIRLLSSEMVTKVLREFRPESHSEVIKIFEAVAILPQLDALSYCMTQWHRHMFRADYKDTGSTEVGVLMDDLLRLYDQPESPTIWQLQWFSQPQSEQYSICPTGFTGAHVATYLGLTELLRRAVLTRDDSTARDSSGRTALWWALHLGNTETARILLAAKYSPYMPDNFGITPAYRAAAAMKQGPYQEDMFTDILRDTIYHLDAWRPDPHSWTYLHFAAATPSSNLVDILLNFLPDLLACDANKARPSMIEYGEFTSTDKSGRTPLHLAAMHGQVESLLVIIEKHYRQRDVHEHLRLMNTEDRRGQTALHLASIQGHLECVKVLLRYGANLLLQDEHGKTATDRAAIMGNDVVHVFLLEEEKSGNAHQRPESLLESLLNYKPPFQFSCANHSVGKRLSRPHRQYPERALFSIMNGTSGYNLNSGISGDIREAGGVEHIVDDRGRTLLHHAAAWGHEGAIWKVLSCLSSDYEVNVAFIDTQDNRGWTALHYAVGMRNLSLAKLLMAEGASASVTTLEGKTVYDLALLHGDKQALEVIARYACMPTDSIALDFGFTEAHCLARDGSLSQNDIIRLGQASILGVLDGFERTPVYRAVEMGHYDIAERLVEFGLADLAEQGEETSRDLLALSSSSRIDGRHVDDDAQPGDVTAAFYMGGSSTVNDNSCA
ncbi:hypothetical protein B0T17DRAFT_257932 [Bombardia bombarda]|uniref:NACHT domain-containing protein n=1 Tax=Bombardia bombarda TaxID=252184 RepID=A0AA39X167_9PEZI|nr:hypothetical protein B0T17DRAFT_257932 [Bombardia bombarda]